SWGKSDGSKAQPTGNPAQTSLDSQPASSKPALPHANTTRPDPLQMPQQFDRRPTEEKPGTPKRDSSPAPTGAGASSPMLKPTMPPVAQSVQAPAPVGNPSVPKQVSTTSGGMPAARTSTMITAPSPAPARQTMAQATNTPGVARPAMPVATVSPMPAADPASM